MSETRSTTTLVCAIFALFLAASIRAAKRRRPVHRAFFFLAIDLAGWYLGQPIYAALDKNHDDVWKLRVVHVGILFAVALPHLLLRLFEAMASGRLGPGSRRLGRVVEWATLGVMAASERLDPSHGWARVLLFVYVLVSLCAVLVSAYPRRAPSPLEAARERAGFLIGVLTCAATVFDFGTFVLYPKSDTTPFGAMVSVLSLFALSEALCSETLPDFRELIARVVAAIVLGVSMAVIFVRFSHLRDKLFDTIYVDVILGITMCLSVDTVRATAVAWTRQLLVPESDLDASLRLLQRRLLHVLTIEEMSSIVMDSLRASRRLTGAGLFLRDPDDTGFDRIAALGAAMPARVEVTAARPLLDRLAQGPLSLEEIEREVRVRRDEGLAPESRDEAALTAAAVLGGPKNTVVAPIRDEAGDLVGLLVIVDERAAGAFSPEEVAAAGKIAGYVGVVIESSRAYAEMKQRDRLAVIGQMTAGLAHEIRNPLGSIKGAAQLLIRLGSAPEGAAESSKFLDIIVEEVDRLARVLDKVLDLAPQKAAVAPIDANAVVRRTVQVFSAEPGHDDLEVKEALHPGLPRVEIDPEQLQQVLLNLLRNSAQATEGRGKVGVSTTVRAARHSWRSDRPGAGLPDSQVEIVVTDNGPGISRKVIEKLFVPFFTTKKEGTGLGLAVSQKIIQEARGRIDVRSHEGQGASFVVLLPAAMDALGTPTPRPAAT